MSVCVFVYVRLSRSETGSRNEQGKKKFSVLHETNAEWEKKKRSRRVSLSRNDEGHLKKRAPNTITRWEAEPVMEGRGINNYS